MTDMTIKEEVELKLKQVYTVLTALLQATDVIVMKTNDDGWRVERDMAAGMIGTLLFLEDYVQPDGSIHMSLADVKELITSTVTETAVMGIKINEGFQDDPDIKKFLDLSVVVMRSQSKENG